MGNSIKLTVTDCVLDYYEKKKTWICRHENLFIDKKTNKYLNGRFFSFHEVKQVSLFSYLPTIIKIHRDHENNV